MSTKLESLRSQALMLRERCVEAHNLLIKDSAYSAVGELARCLEPGLKLDNDSPRLRLLSSYTFWGLRRLGGSRSGFEKRLRRIAGPANLDLHKTLKSSVFAAWRCVESTEGIATETVWEPVGYRDGDFRADGIFNGNCEPLAPRVGDIYAGWCLERDETVVLAHAFGLAEEGASRLMETADERGWHDENDDEEFQRVEYDRDVLTQSLRPDWEQCGLEEYYFLPPAQRSSFPDEFRRAVMERLFRFLWDGHIPWHVRLARSDEQWIDENLRPKLQELRVTAATYAGRYRGDRIDDPDLAKLVSDDECLELLGLTPECEPIADPFVPLASHPVHLLDLDEEWFDEGDVAQRTTIKQARAVLEDADGPRIEVFEEAVERHRVRIRWIGIMEYMLDHPLQDWFYGLQPEYGALREVVDEIFDPVIDEMPLSVLLADRGRAATRIENALEKAGVGVEPRCVRDLPMTEYGLVEIPGIGSGSLEAVEEALVDALLAWPPELERGGEVVEQAREEIDAGLDELEGLFG